MTKIKDVKTSIYKWTGEIVPSAQNFCTNPTDALRESGDKMKSLPPGITEETLTADIALATIAMPVEIGIDKNTNLPIMKDIGRYGPYLKCGKNNSFVII